MNNRRHARRLEMPTTRSQLSLAVASLTCILNLILAALLIPGCAILSPDNDTSGARATHPELRAQLLDLCQRDQEARRTLVELMQQQSSPQSSATEPLQEDTLQAMRAVESIDRESTAFLHSMIEQHGWPTFTMAGRDGAHSAWVLAQHADADPALQAQVLQLLGPLLERHEASATDFALLTDRVRLAQGEPQWYGSQFADDEHGVLRPRPIANFDDVDSRRATVGLPPLAEYARRLGEVYRQKVDLTPLPTVGESP